jgi:hypothetical protein
MSRAASIFAQKAVLEDGLTSFYRYTADVAKAANLSHSYTLQTLKELEVDGLVERHPSSSLLKWRRL